jgi:hypothetical protein
MNKISNVLSELGVSKVRLAKYLGVSRQMLYNYLACESLEDWPSEKATRLMQLLEIKSESDLDNLTIDGDYIIKIDTKLNEGVKIALSSSNLVDLKGFNRKEVEVLTDITTLLKDRLKDDKTKDTYNTFVYLYHYLQSMETNKELKYLLCFVSKLTGFTKPREFLYNQEQQILFESIMYSGFTLYNNGGASRTKIGDTHERFVREIEQKHEEKLSRTQELNAVKLQALKELGYTTITADNAKEVFEKIAEIQSRKV